MCALQNMLLLYKNSFMNKKVFLVENVVENVICWLSAMLFRFQDVKSIIKDQGTLS